MIFGKIWYKNEESLELLVQKGAIENRNTRRPSTAFTAKSTIKKQKTYHKTN